MNDYIVAGTGSRSLQTRPLEEKKYAADLIEARLNFYKISYGKGLVVLSGMAEGFDAALAIGAIALNIRLWCAIPNRGYLQYYWGSHSLTGKNRMPAATAILANAEKIVYVAEEIHGQPEAILYYKVNDIRKHANFHRNDYMVDMANEFLVWDASSSGTKDCFASIKKTGKPYIVLY